VKAPASRLSADMQLWLAHAVDALRRSTAAAVGDVSIAKPIKGRPSIAVPDATRMFSSADDSIGAAAMRAADGNARVTRLKYQMAHAATHRWSRHRRAAGTLVSHRGR
jgi:hypothetical protein